MDVFYDELDNIYKIKTDNTLESLEKINAFFEKWFGKFKPEHIPDLMKLFYNNADTWEQNRFVSETIGDIVREYPDKSAELIIKNIDVLFRENGSECLLELAAILECTDTLDIQKVVDVLLEVDEEHKIPFLKRFEKERDSGEEEAKEILDLYNNRKIGL